MLPSTPSETAAVVIASRESAATLLATLAALQGADQAPALIDLVVNGNHSLASQMLAVLPSRPAPLNWALPRLRLWSLPLGDKAHAMNEYLHRIWPGNAPAFFVDGYVRVRAEAPALLAQALATAPGVLAATGVPGSGRTAASMRAQMRTEGGLHGNFFVLGVPALKALRALKFRLPLGLYRTDATLGAALSFGLDPSKNGWDPLRHIRVEDRARWDVEAKPWWQLAEMKAQWRRRQRQAQGRLENRSVRNLYAERRSPISVLPSTARDLVLGWQAAERADFLAMLASSQQVRRAFDRLLMTRDWTSARSAPELHFDSGTVAEAAPPP